MKQLCPSLQQTELELLQQKKYCCEEVIAEDGICCPKPIDVTPLRLSTSFSVVYRKVIWSSGSEAVFDRSRDRYCRSAKQPHLCIQSGLNIVTKEMSLVVTLWTSLLDRILVQMHRQNPLDKILKNKANSPIWKVLLWPWSFLFLSVWPNNTQQHQHTPKTNNSSTYQLQSNSCFWQSFVLFKQATITMNRKLQNVLPQNVFVDSLDDMLQRINGGGFRSTFNLLLILFIHSCVLVLLFIFLYYFRDWR